MPPSAIRANASSDTLLSYVMYTSPDPLQASAKNAILTLVVSNPGTQVVTVTRVVVTLPVGTNAKDLTADATGVQTGVPAGWQAVNAAGSITLTPSGAAGKVGTAGLDFTFAALAVNAQVGLCTVTIDETASSPSQPARERTASIGLPKFPAQFQVGELQANPLYVPAGGATTLMWRGSGSPAAYTIEYTPADVGPLVGETVGSTGPYRAANLTRSGQVTFTLRVQVPVPGMDQPLTVERQVGVSVETLSLTMEVEPLSVGVNGLVRLAWRTNNAASCSLAVAPSTASNRGGPVEPEGSRYFVVAQTTTFTLTVLDANKNKTQQQRTVAVDPAIVPTVKGYVVTGTPGTPGAPGAPFWDRAQADTVGHGGGGGPGGPALLRVTLPPLGDDPTRVIPLTVKGGPGGPGGDGGELLLDPRMRSGFYGPAGQGGDGGTAELDLCFSEREGSPVQYILTVAGGDPGAGGKGGEWHETVGPAGSPGAARPIRFRDAE